VCFSRRDHSIPRNVFDYAPRPHDGPVEARPSSGCAPPGRRNSFVLISVGCFNVLYFDSLQMTAPLHMLPQTPAWLRPFHLNASYLNCTRLCWSGLDKLECTGMHWTIWHWTLTIWHWIVVWTRRRAAVAEHSPLAAWKLLHGRRAALVLDHTSPYNAPLLLLPGQWHASDSTQTSWPQHRHACTTTVGAAGAAS
jgi:hypothetical protein